MKKGPLTYRSLLLSKTPEALYISRYKPVREGKLSSRGGRISSAEGISLSWVGDSEPGYRIGMIWMDTRGNISGERRKELNGQREG